MVKKLGTSLGPARGVQGTVVGASQPVKPVPVAAAPAAAAPAPVAPPAAAGLSKAKPVTPVPVSQPSAAAAAQPPPAVGAGVAAGVVSTSAPAAPAAAAAAPPETKPEVLLQLGEAAMQPVPPGGTKRTRTRWRTVGTETTTQLMVMITDEQGVATIYVEDPIPQTSDAIQRGRAARVALRRDRSLEGHRTVKEREALERLKRVRSARHHARAQQLVAMVQAGSARRRPTSAPGASAVASANAALSAAGPATASTATGAAAAAAASEETAEDIARAALLKAQVAESAAKLREQEAERAYGKAEGERRAFANSLKGRGGRDTTAAEAERLIKLGGAASQARSARARARSAVALREVEVRDAHARPGAWKLEDWRPTAARSTANLERWRASERGQTPGTAHAAALAEFGPANPTATSLDWYNPLDTPDRTRAPAHSFGRDERRGAFKHGEGGGGGGGGAASAGEGAQRTKWGGVKVGGDGLDKDSYGGPRWSFAPYHAPARRVFATLDAENRGVVGVEQLAPLLCGREVSGSAGGRSSSSSSARHNETMTRADVEQLVTRFDKDHDGALSRTEFAAAWAALALQVQPGSGVGRFDMPGVQPNESSPKSKPHFGPAQTRDGAPRRPPVPPASAAAAAAPSAVEGRSFVRAGHFDPNKARPGYVFKKGAKGLGFYKESMSAATPALGALPLDRQGQRVGKHLAAPRHPAATNVGWSNPCNALDRARAPAHSFGRDERMGRPSDTHQFRGTAEPDIGHFKWGGAEPRLAPFNERA